MDAVTIESPALVDALAAVAEGRGGDREAAAVRAASRARSGGARSGAAWSGSEAIARVPDLVAHPAAGDPATWHLDRLAATLPGDDAPAQLRARWHARWAWHALAPDDPRSAPLVSIVIPVFNRAALVAEAIESALAQSYPRVEVVVADDGSTDGTWAALTRFGARIVAVRHAPNRGVAAARNLALRHAAGDLVQFLDSDNLLLPDSVAAKVAALRAVPDSELCYSHRTVEYLGGDVPRQPDRPHPLRGPDSPIDDPLAMLTACRFIVSATLVARHRLAALGGFDERLRGAEDYRLWSRLALAGIKSIAIDRPLVRRRFAADSLSVVAGSIQRWEIAARLLVVADCLERPDLWRTAWRMLLFTRTWPGWAATCDDGDAHAAPFRDELAARVERLPALASHHGLSARPLLAVLDGVIRARPLAAMPDAPLPFERRLLDAVAAAMRVAPDADLRDAAHWRAAPPLTEEIPALRALAAAYDRALAAGRPWFAPADALWGFLPRRFTRPWRRDWRTVWFVTKRLGRPAGRIFAMSPRWLREAARAVLHRPMKRALRARSRRFSRRSA